MDADELRASAEEQERFRFRLTRLLAGGRRDQLRRLMARWSWSQRLPAAVRQLEGTLEEVRDQLASHVAVRLGPHPHHAALPALEDFFRELGELGIGDRRELANLAHSSGVHWAPPGPWRRLRGSHPLSQAALVLALFAATIGVAGAAWWSHPVHLAPCLRTADGRDCLPLNRQLVSLEERLRIRCAVDPRDDDEAAGIAPSWRPVWEVYRDADAGKALPEEAPCDLGWLRGLRRVDRDAAGLALRVRDPLPMGRAYAVRLGDDADARTCCWFSEPEDDGLEDLDERGLAAGVHLEARDLWREWEVVLGTRLGEADSCDRTPADLRVEEDLRPGAWACVAGIQDQDLARAVRQADDGGETVASQSDQVIFEPCHYAATWAHNRRPSPKRWEVSPIEGCLDAPLGPFERPRVSQLLVFHASDSEGSLDATLHGQLLRLEAARWSRRWTATDAGGDAVSGSTAAVPRPGQQRTFLFRDLVGEANAWMRRAGTRGLGPGECHLARSLVLEACGLSRPQGLATTEAGRGT